MTTRLQSAEERGAPQAITRRRSLQLLVGGLVGGLVATLGGEAQAGGTHKIPDLRRDPKGRGRGSGATLRIPLTVHLAVSDERPAATMRRLERALAEANRAFAPFQIEVVVRERLRMPSGFESLTRRRDRRRIAHFARPDGSVHVFMVDTLELGSRRRGDRSVRGLHWRYRGILRGLRQRQYVVVSGDAPTTTLAHELGHYFGLSHSDRDDNLMCSCRRGPLQLFTPTQGATLRREVRGFLGS